MKPKDDSKTEVTATTKVKLTIRGQTFDMTMDELKALHEKIKGVVDANKVVVTFEREERRRERPWPYIPPQWFHQPAQPDWPGDRIMCLTSGEGS